MDTTTLSILVFIGCFGLGFVGGFPGVGAIIGMVLATGIFMSGETQKDKGRQE